MPSGVADYGQSTWLQALFGVIAPITAYWVALAADEPGAGMDGDILADLEPDDPAYSRQYYPASSYRWAADANVLTSLVDVVFPVAAADWGQVSHFALCTGVVSGNLYGWGEFMNPQLVSAGDQLVIAAGGLVLALTGLDDSITV